MSPTNWWAKSNGGSATYYLKSKDTNGNVETVWDSLRYKMAFSSSSLFLFLFAFCRSNSIWRGKIRPIYTQLRWKDSKRLTIPPCHCFTAMALFTLRERSLLHILMSLLGISTAFNAGTSSQLTALIWHAIPIFAGANDTVSPLFQRPTPHSRLQYSALSRPVPFLPPSQFVCRRRSESIALETKKNQRFERIVAVPAFIPWLNLRPGILLVGENTLVVRSEPWGTVLK